MARDNSVTAGYGSYKTFQISGLVKATHGDFSVMGSGKYMNTDGWDFNFRNTFGTPRTFEHDRENYGGFAQAKYKRLTFTGFSGGDKTILPRELNGILGMGPFRTRRHFFDAQYDQPLGENWDASLNVTYNGFFLKLGAFSPPEAPRPLIGTVNMNDLLIEPSIKGSMLDGKLNILMGYTFQRLRGTITELGPGFDVTFVNDWHNEYLQVDYSPWDFLKIIAGVQFNKVTGVPLNISPRGGAIVNFSPEVGIKLLYGEAFRAAYALEKASLGPLVIGNPTLQSEQIATFDAQLFYTSKKFKASLTYYFSKQTQTITEVFTPPVLFPIFIPPQINYINSGVINYEGIEFETQWQISPGWSFMGSMSYQENHDDTGLYDVGLIPNFMAKAGISYVSPEGISVGLFNSYYSDSAKLQGTLPLNPPAEGHNWMTFKGSVPLKALTDRSDIPNMIFSIYGENLLVEDVYFPELF
ncbi:MAG: TonB-dependent receptor [Planctomycetes bacterium]|nr:TonB-dependent receptor [Planctomycetota bacterium]